MVFSYYSCCKAVIFTRFFHLRSKRTHQHINNQDRKIISIFFSLWGGSCSLVLMDLWWDDCQQCLCELNTGVSINPKVHITHPSTSLTAHRQLSWRWRTLSCQCCHRLNWRLWSARDLSAGRRQLVRAEVSHRMVIPLQAARTATPSPVALSSAPVQTLH